MLRDRIGLVPRTRSSHHIAAGTVANFGFKSGTRIIDLLVSFSIPKFAQKSRQMLANFGIGTLAALACGLATTPAAAAEFVMKIGTATINETQHQFIKFYKEALEKASGGRIDRK